MKKTNFDRYLDGQMKDPAFAARLEQASEAWDVALQLAALRQQAGFRSRILLRRLKTSQQHISRLESPGYEGRANLRRVAHVLKARVRVVFEPEGTDSGKNTVSRGFSPRGSPQAKVRSSFMTTISDTQELARRFNEDEAIWQRFQEKRLTRHLARSDSPLPESALDHFDWLDAEREIRTLECGDLSPLLIALTSQRTPKQA